MRSFISSQRPFIAIFSIVLLLLSGCAAKVVTIDGNYPVPLAQKLPLTLGVYYDQAFANHHYIEINDENGKDQFIINNGASQKRLFNTILPAVFSNVILIDELEALDTHPAVDLIFTPAIEDFQLGLPLKTKLDVYEVWLKYNMRLSKSNGEYIADWVMTAYGKSPQKSFQSAEGGINTAAVNALRDLAASFTLGFSSVPEVKAWLEEEGLLND